MKLDFRQKPNLKPAKNGLPNPNMTKKRFPFFLIIFLFAIFLSLFWFSGDVRGVENIAYSDFMRLVEKGDIQSARISNFRRIDGTFYNIEGARKPYKTVIPYTDNTLVEKLISRGILVEGATSEGSIGSLLLGLLPWVLMFFFFWMIFRQVNSSSGKAFSFGRSTAKKYDENGKKITFNDVAGHKEVKEELIEVVDFLKNPLKFNEIGARIPKGVLLVGMPGTGKTLLARAIAGEAGVSFFHISGSEFVEMFVGVGASRVRDLFEKGRKNAPCIIFIDELDAVGRARGAGYGGGHDEREQTLNQLLVEMDGFDNQHGIIVMAATNRPDVLDPALLRPGRFDRQVVVGLPDVKERREIIELYLNRVRVGKDIQIERLAKTTVGFSGADLFNLVNEAALYAARRNSKLVEMHDFEDARDKLILGIARKSRVSSEKDKLAVAYHEAGHALLHYLVKDAGTLHKVTIIPRARALGVAMSLADDKDIIRKSDVVARIKVAYGGYAAEKIIYNETGVGVQNDLEQATALARRMVVEWGMSDVGALSLRNSDAPVFLGKEIARPKDYSEHLAQKVDQEVSRILEYCLKEAEQVLRENRDNLERLAMLLVEKETLTDDEIREQILGLEKRPEEAQEMFVSKMQSSI